MHDKASVDPLKMSFGGNQTNNADVQSNGGQMYEDDSQY